MISSHTLRKLFVSSLFLVLLGIAPGFANVVVTSTGVGAPPTTVGPYAITPFGPDVRPEFTDVTTVASPACGNISFSPALGKREIGSGWATWSNGYTGSVYRTAPASSTDVVTLTINLPAGTSAFSFYAEPERFGLFNVEAIADNGTSTGPILVNGLAGAQNFGFYGIGNTISSIKVTFAAGARGGAIGEFGISCQPVQAVDNVKVSDQKAGSILAFPYYNSKSGSDTRLTISNTGVNTSNVHMFFIDSSCNQADQYICLTANASASFLASEYDPENTGYLLAVAVNDAGQPIQDNSLIGNAFVNDGAYVGNYGAESFWAYSAPAAMNTTNMTAILNFNGGIYDFLPTRHVAEIQSPNDVVGQRIITVGLNGSVVTGGIGGAGQVGIGLAYNDGEKPASYSSPFVGGCQRSFTIDPRTPRVPGGLGSQTGINNPALIPSGRTGTLKWNSGGSVGLILTPRQGTNKWSGIRTLHKTAVSAGALVIPVVSVSACRNDVDM